MATNIGNKLSTSGTDLFFTTLGMPNTSENMYKTVTYCDSYTGMESVLGTVNADTTYSKTQSDMITGSHTFDSTTGLHTNIWTWNANSNTTGDDSGQVTGTFSLPTSTSIISADGGTITFTPTGLTIQQSPNTTSFRYIDEPITVTVGTHKDTYDYGGTVSFNTSDTSPKGIAQNFYNRGDAYYTLNLVSNQSWVTPLSQDIDITSNTPSGVTVNVAKQSVSTKSGEGLAAYCKTNNIVPKEGGTKTMNLLCWNGSSYTGFTIPSASARKFNLSYSVIVNNSNTTPSGLNGTTTTITQRGKTVILSYSNIVDDSFAYISTGATANVVMVNFNPQTCKASTISGEIYIDDDEIYVDEYSDLANKEAPTVSVNVLGWSMTDPINVSSRTATFTSSIKWTTNVDTVNTSPLSVTYTFIQEGSSYSDPSGKLFVHITGDDMSKYPIITNANSTSYSGTYEAVFDISKSDTFKSIDIQFPWIRPSDIGGSANGSVTLPDNVSDTTTYFTSKTWTPSITSNLTFVNAHVEAQDPIEWEMSIADFVRGNSDINDTTTYSQDTLILRQDGNEYTQATKTTVGIAATTDASWLTPTSSLTLSDSKSSGNISFDVANNNAYLTTWSARLRASKTNMVIGITSDSKNTDSRSATITWKTTNSGDGTISVNHNTSTYTQAASYITGDIKLNITGNAITGNSLSYTFNSYPINSKYLAYTVPSSRIIHNRNYWDPSSLEIEIPEAISYDTSQYATNILDLGKLTIVTPTTYTIDFSCQNLSVGSKKIISSGSYVDSAWALAYIKPTNGSSIAAYTFSTYNLDTKYTCTYRWWSGDTVINNSDEIVDLPSDEWSDWQTFTGDSITIDVGTNDGISVAPSISKNSNTTLQGGWAYTSGSTMASSQKYFATQVKVVDNYDSSKTNTASDFYYQYGHPASSNDDKVVFTLKSTTNCSVSGNYTTAQVGSSIPSSVTVFPVYSSGTKSWYKNDVYYGTSEPTQSRITTWSGSVSKNLNNVGTEKIAVWDDISEYDYTCGVTGGSSTYTEAVTGDGFTKYYKYAYSATMYPNCDSSLAKTQSGIAQSLTTNVTEYSSSTVYNRYISWDGGSTWGTTLTKTLSSANNYSLAWQWKYATSTSASGLYSGSGSATITQDTSSTMSIGGSISLSATSDTVYQEDTASISCSISSNTISATETSTGSGNTRSITPTTQIYYSTDNSKWTAGSSYSLPTTTSTSTGSRTIYWKCVVTASGYSSTTKTFTTTSTIYVKPLYSYSTEYDTTTEYQEKSDSRSTSSSYSGSTPSVSTSGGGSIDYWTSSATVSASSSSSTSVTQTTTSTWKRQKRTGTRSRTVTTNNKTGNVTYGSWGSYSYDGWTDYDDQSSTSTSTVTGSITIQYSTNNSSWSNGSSTTVTPTAGSSGSTTGTSSTIYFRALLYYGSTLVATGSSSSVSVSKYGVSYYNQ